MKKTPISKFDPTKSIERARKKVSDTTKWSIKVPSGEFVWSNRMERLDLLRKGLPYDAIESVSKKSNLPGKQILMLLDLPQTTYNKKKKDKDVLNGRDSEIILMLTELMDFGLEVFNNESEKFQRWLKKPNIALGNVKPESLFDSVTGIQEVKNSLNRLEYGNLA